MVKCGDGGDGFTPDPIGLGKWLTITVTVTDTTTPATIPQGGVNVTMFNSAGEPIDGWGVVALSNGKAVVTTIVSPFLAGVYTVTAQYAGVPDHLLGSSAQGSFTVQPE